MCKYEMLTFKHPSSKLGPVFYVKNDKWEDFEGSVNDFLQERLDFCEVVSHTTTTENLSVPYTIHTLILKHPA